MERRKTQVEVLVKWRHLMFSHSVTDKAPKTKQLVFHNIHLASDDERQGIIYNDGIPDRLMLSIPDQSTHTILVDLNPIMVIGRKRSMRDYEVTIDLTDLHAAEYGVSRYHAILMAMDNHIIIKDIDSLNGTYLNGKRLEALKEYVIDDEDMITFGDLNLKVSFIYT